MAGRPLKFLTVEDLKASIDEYFAKPEREWKISGLAVYLDCDTQTLLNYEKKNDGFFATIKRAKTKIESAWEQRLIDRGNGGDIFALKNFGWTDKTEQELYGKDGKDLIPSPLLKNVRRDNSIAESNADEKED